MKVWAVIHQGPNSAGRARHFAPFLCRQKMAETVRRRLLGGTLACGRHGLDQPLQRTTTRRD